MEVNVIMDSSRFSALYRFPRPSPRGLRFKEEMGKAGSEKASDPIAR